MRETQIITRSEGGIADIVVDGTDISVPLDLNLLGSTDPHTPLRRKVRESCSEAGLDGECRLTTESQFNYGAAPGELALKITCRTENCPMGLSDSSSCS